MKKLILVFVFIPVVALGCGSSSSKNEDGDNGAGSGGTSGGGGTSGTSGSGGSAGSGGGNAGVAAFVTSYCNAVMPCCAQAGFPTDGAQCRALLGGLVADGGYAFDQAAATECTAWLATASSSGMCPDTDAAPAVCERIFLPTGNAAPGQSCVSGGDCALSPEGEVLCTGEAAGAFCQLRIQGIEGSAPCAWSERDGLSTSTGNLDQPRVYTCDAADGLRCDGNACVRLIAQGGVCASTDECTGGTFCSPEGGCQPLLPVGAVCKFFDQCSHGQCTNQVCVADSGDIGLSLLCGAN